MPCGGHYQANRSNLTISGAATRLPAPGPATGDTGGPRARAVDHALTAARDTRLRNKKLRRADRAAQFFRA